jgi:hypothetical protein
MLKVPVLEAKRNLFIQMLVRRHEISDPGFITYLKQSLTDENDLYLHDLADALSHMFDFHFEWIDVPHQVHDDHAEGYNYFIVGAIRIPSLLPYAEHPLFIEFTRNLEIYQSSGSGNCVELVYLPDSKIATDPDPAHHSFARQPATFMVGMQDNGGMDIHTTIDFLMELRGINHFIKLLVEGERITHD